MIDQELFDLVAKAAGDTVKRLWAESSDFNDFVSRLQAHIAEVKSSAGVVGNQPSDSGRALGETGAGVVGNQECKG